MKAKASKNLCPLLLDVTNPESIEHAIQQVATSTDHQLQGLVNNAGIAPSGPLECLSLESIRHIFEVNIIGLLAVTQACLPMLKRSKGRIVNIGSSSGLVALPMMSTYAATKFGVKAISDSLRLELQTFGISVSLVAPGKIQSDIWKKAESQASELRNQTTPETLAPYQPFFAFFEKILQQTGNLPSADYVARAVQHALTAPRPRRRYLVGYDAMGAAILSYLPMNLRDWLLSKALRV